MQLIEKHNWCEIDVDAIIHNYNKIIKHTNLPLFATVKSDAYGHGAPFISKVYQDLDVLGLSVSSFSEAIQLRKSGITKPILILGYTEPHLAQELFLNNITQTIFSLDYAKELNKQALFPIDCHIKIDTGMGRIGFDTVNDVKKALDEIYKLKDLQNIKCTGLFTHFASSDMAGDYYENYTLKQIDLFNEVKSNLKNKGFDLKFFHGQNSAAIARKFSGEFNVTRPGGMLYGYHPSNEVSMDGLMPAFSLKAIVTHIKRIKPSQFIGYGLTYKATKDTNIATVCLGFGDGFPRNLSTTNYFVNISGKDYPLAGRICMDQFMVDLGDDETVKVGDEVLVIGGTGKQSMFDASISLGTLPGNLLALVPKRVPRVYKKNNQIIHIEYSI